MEELACLSGDGEADKDDKGSSDVSLPSENGDAQLCGEFCPSLKKLRISVNVFVLIIIIAVKHQMITINSVLVRIAFKGKCDYP